MAVIHNYHYNGRGTKRGAMIKLNSAPSKEKTIVAHLSCHPNDVIKIFLFLFLLFFGWKNHEFFLFWFLAQKLTFFLGFKLLHDDDHLHHDDVWLLFSFIGRLVGSWPLLYIDATHAWNFFCFFFVLAIKPPDLEENKRNYRYNDNSF